MEIRKTGKEWETKKARGGVWKKEVQERSGTESYRRRLEKGRAGKYWEEGIRDKKER